MACVDDHPFHRAFDLLLGTVAADVAVRALRAGLRELLSEEPAPVASRPERVPAAAAPKKAARSRRKSAKPKGRKRPPRTNGALRTDGTHRLTPEQCSRLAFMLEHDALGVRSGAGVSAEVAKQAATGVLMAPEIVSRLREFVASG
jgi:hypothetical protein